MNVYLWLSQFYLDEPTPRRLRELLDKTLLDSFQGLFASEGLESFSWLRKFQEALGDILAEDVRAQYQELFLVPVIGAYVPPCESCFRERESSDATSFGGFWGESAFDVLNFYREASYEPGKLGLLPPDHLGVELAFMAKLCQDETTATQEGDFKRQTRLRELERAFLEEHILRWIDDYFVSVEKSRSSGFYTCIASLTKVFVRTDHRWLSMEVDLAE